MNSEYLDLVKKAQEKKIVLVKKQKKYIKDLYGDVASELDKKVKKSSENSLTERWLKDYRKQFKKQIKVLNNELKQNIEESMLKGANYANNVQIDFFNSLSDSYKLSFKDMFSNMFSKIPQNAVNELISGGFYKDGIGLSKRLWNHEGKVNAQFDYIIQKGLLEKKSSYELAKDLEVYINPNKKQDWDFNKIYPNVGNKKIEYNSFRLAVTSISHAYQLSMQRSCKINPFVEGIKWHTSNSHRGPCALCLSREGKIYAVNDLPMDHPLGVCCFVPIVPKSMDEVGEELNEWINGGNNPALDKLIENEGVKLNNIKTIEKPTWQDFNYKEKDFKSKAIIKKYLLDKHDIKFSDSRSNPIDTELLSDCVNWLDKFHEYFHGFKEINPIKFNNIKVKANMGSSVGYYRYYTNIPEAVELALNCLYFKDKQGIIKYVEHCKETNWTVANAEAHKTFVHEYGHHVAHAFEWIELKDNKHNKNWCKDFIKEVMDEYSSKYGCISYNDLPGLVSEYGATRSEETFAETFAEFFGGKNPRTFAKLFGKKLEEKLKKYI